MTGRHAALDSITSALPNPALVSINDLNSLSPSEIKLKYVSSTLIIVVLMRGTIYYMTVRQLYP